MITEVRNTPTVRSIQEKIKSEQEVKIKAVLYFCSISGSQMFLTTKNTTKPNKNQLHSNRFSYSKGNWEFPASKEIAFIRLRQKTGALNVFS